MSDHPSNRSFPKNENTFFLFGMGNRRKLLYSRGQLKDLFSGQILFSFRISQEQIIPEEYRVSIITDAGEDIQLFEEQEGIWLCQRGSSSRLEGSEINLPEFKLHPYRQELRILHHEILVNIWDGKPLPNCLVYSKPWLRDGAMVALVLQETGNLTLISDWISHLDSPYDRNNAGICEPDNLGQAMVLLSMTTGIQHPLFPLILGECAQWIKQNGYLSGTTDFGQHPIYQTQWFKFGLKSLGLPWEAKSLCNLLYSQGISLSSSLYDKILKLKLEEYPADMSVDQYAALCWWEKRGIKVYPQEKLFQNIEDYPYLGWAEAHFYNLDPPFHLSHHPYPITWESNASQADYPKIALISEESAQQKIAYPHTWHAAEMFLYLNNFSRRLT